ncbi:MAG: hypothetical protein AB1634_00430 [Thermodesulfobacteriota bacterium]
MDLQRHLDRAVALIKAAPAVLIGGGLVAFVLAGASFGILAGPSLGAYCGAIVRALRAERPPGWADLLPPGRHVLALLPFSALPLGISLVFSLTVVFQSLLFLVPGVILVVWWLYTLPLMADQGLGLLPAMGASRQKVAEQGFFPHLSYLFVVFVVPELILTAFRAVFGDAPIIPPLISLLHILLIPLQTGCLAGLYLDAFPPPAAPPSLLDQ